MEDKERLRAEARYPSRTGCRSHLTYEGRSCRGAAGTSKRRDGSDRRQRRSSTATRCRAVAHCTKAMDVNVEPLVVVTCYVGLCARIMNKVRLHQSHENTCQTRQAMKWISFQQAVSQLNTCPSTQTSNMSIRFLSLVQSYHQLSVTFLRSQFLCHNGAVSKRWQAI
jgi:hypothetical protein